MKKPAASRPLLSEASRPRRPVAVLRPTAAGLFCPKGGFHIDPTSPVACAIITHAHGDHASKGHRKYLTSVSGAGLLQHRMGPHAKIETMAWGEPKRLGEVTVSLHPAGHVLGSAQIRVQNEDQVWVFTGDYRRAPDSTCEPFEVVPCGTLITETTFGNPCFRWPDIAREVARLHDWWRSNQARGHASVIYAYALGKAQRVLGLLDPSVGPIYVHPAVAELNPYYRDAGVRLPECGLPTDAAFADDWPRALLIQPPSARWKGTAYLPGRYATAFASGWMMQEGETDRRGVETGFVISDHADYHEIVRTIEECGAKTVYLTHGNPEPLLTTLRAAGLSAYPLDDLRVARA